MIQVKKSKVLNLAQSTGYFSIVRFFLVVSMFITEEVPFPRGNSLKNINGHMSAWPHDEL